MKIAVLYGTTRGSTARIVSNLAKFVKFSFDAYNVKEIKDLKLIEDYNLLIFFCPTYGDMEPQEDIENFLMRFNIDMSEKYFAVCRIGTYEGYDLFEPSCGRIVRVEMLNRGGIEIIQPISIDSLPGIDQIALGRWFVLLDEWVKNNV